MKVPAKVKKRFVSCVTRYKRILTSAYKKDVNESDTVIIIQDILSEVLGFDKYSDITTEYAIRKTFCDIVIKLNDKVQVIIEAKSIGTDLKDIHLNQALNYGLKEGVKWIVLTNGIEWHVYHLEQKTPLSYQILFKLNFSEINLKKDEDVFKLYILSKEGLESKKLELLQQKVSTFNKETVSAILMQDKSLNEIRKTIRKVAPEVKVSIDEIKEVLKTKVIKRDIIEDQDFEKLCKKISRKIS
jgi:hypothetical protein